MRKEFSTDTATPTQPAGTVAYSKRCSNPFEQWRRVSAGRTHAERLAMVPIENYAHHFSLSGDP